MYKAKKYGQPYFPLFAYIFANTWQVVYKKIWNHNPNQTLNTRRNAPRPWSLDTLKMGWGK